MFNRGPDRPAEASHDELAPSGCLHGLHKLFVFPGVYRCTIDRLLVRENFLKVLEHWTPKGLCGDRGKDCRDFEGLRALRQLSS
jgi:hypothetical protein